MKGSRGGAEPVDLLGDPVIRRKADFPYPGVRRSLSRDWGPGPRALVIGCNPSTANALVEDQTSRWWNAWFQLYGFGGYDAMNLYPFCSPSPAECKRIVDGIGFGDWHTRDMLQFVNLPALVRAAKAAHQVFVCWGAIAWEQDWIDHVVEEIQSGIGPWPDLWCWGTTASGAPKHTAARGRHRIARDQAPILWKAGHA